MNLKPGTRVKGEMELFSPIWFFCPTTRIVTIVSHHVTEPSPSASHSLNAKYRQSYSLPARPYSIKRQSMLRLPKKLGKKVQEIMNVEGFCAYRDSVSIKRNFLNVQNQNQIRGRQVLDSLSIGREETLKSRLSPNQICQLVMSFTNKYGANWNSRQYLPKNQINCLWKKV